MVASSYPCKNTLSWSTTASRSNSGKTWMMTNISYRSIQHCECSALEELWPRTRSLTRAHKTTFAQGQRIQSTCASIDLGWPDCRREEGSQKIKFHFAMEPLLYRPGQPLPAEIHRGFPRPITLWALNLSRQRVRPHGSVKLSPSGFPGSDPVPHVPQKKTRFPIKSFIIRGDHAIRLIGHRHQHTRAVSTKASPWDFGASPLPNPGYRESGSQPQDVPKVELLSQITCNPWWDA
jgi:hypothetical protein